MVKLVIVLVSMMILNGCSNSDNQIIWSDEFDHGALPNTEKWDYEEGYVRNNEKQYYTRERSKNARIENDMLVLEAHYEDYKDMNYTAASVTTKGKLDFLYGRIEVRAKLPEGRGSWPAIWMLGTNIDEVNWPLCGEIDIMENVGYDQHKVHGNIHTKAYNHNLGTNKGNYLVDSTYSSDFHIYAINWRKDRIDFFIDDEKYFTFENDGKGDPATWPFDKPHYLLINYAVGGFWGGQKGIDSTAFPQQYLVDYVRYSTLD